MVKSVRRRAPSRISLMSSRAALGGQASGSSRSLAGPSTSTRWDSALGSSSSSSSSPGRSCEADLTVTLIGPASPRAAGGPRSRPAPARRRPCRRSGPRPRRSARCRLSTPSRAPPQSLRQPGAQRLQVTHQVLELDLARDGALCSPQRPMAGSRCRADVLVAARFTPRIRLQRSDINASKVSVAGDRRWWSRHASTRRRRRGSRPAGRHAA